MNSKVVKGALGGTACVATWIAYDYNTCTPMRKMMGYDVGGAFIRLHNALAVWGVVPTVSRRTMSLSELGRYDGKEGRPTYFSSEGLVWDVSSSETFQSAYGNWAGKDATVALARMSLDSNDVNRTDYASLSEEDIKSLQSWTQYFAEKYFIKGRLKEFIEWDSEESPSTSKK